MVLGSWPTDPADRDPDIAAERLREIVGTCYGPTHVTVPRVLLAVVLAELERLRGAE